MSRSISIFLLILFIRGPLMSHAEQGKVAPGDRDSARGLDETAAISAYLMDLAFEPLDYLLLAGQENTQHVESYKVEFTKYMDKLDRRFQKSGNQIAFLEHVFYRTHGKFLKHYIPYGTFHQVFQTGEYDCLTGTALYALILEHFGFRYRIIDDAYHTYILVEVNDQSILMESTDPIYGFVQDPLELQERIQSYQTQREGERMFKFTDETPFEINIYELVGLLYYNQAIVSFNMFDFRNTQVHLRKAMVFYPSPRILELFVLARASELVQRGKLVAFQ